MLCLLTLNIGEISYNLMLLCWKKREEGPKYEKKVIQYDFKSFYKWMIVNRV